MPRQENLKFEASLGYIARLCLEGRKEKGGRDEREEKKRRKE
jgi:hypothetical protein